MMVKDFIQFSPELMEKFGTIVLKRKREWNFLQKIWYKLDWRNSKLVDLQEWFEASLPELSTNKEFMNKCEYFKQIRNVDDRAVAILQFVKRILTYIGDVNTWGVGEMWQTPLQTWTKREYCPRCRTTKDLAYETVCSCKTKVVLKRTGDCEDGALLIGAFMFYCNIPAYQWHIECGSVIGGGHAYLVYNARRNALTYVLDWCYWYDSRQVPDRKTIANLPKYLRAWFGFNHAGSWKSIKSPNNMFKK